MLTQESILMVAAEASADIHGAKVVRAIKADRPAVSLFGVGGAAMRAEGFDAAVHTERMSVAGLTEVLLFLPRLLLFMWRLRKLARERRPQVAVLIDAPDFNLRLARYLKRLKIPVVYYISPQLWAWRPSRVSQIRELVDRMLVILPFEKPFYEQRGVKASFVGHPLVEHLPESPDREGARESLGIAQNGAPVLALLPGSRHVEVTRHLPIMLEGVRELMGRFPGLRAVIPVASTIPKALVDRLAQRSGVPVKVVDGCATEVLSAADAAVVASGTATLQTALLARPMVVVYRVSWLTFQILKRLVTVAHIALVNLVAGRGLVPELIQSDFTAERVAGELGRMLDDQALRAQLEDDLKSLRARLGRGDTAKRVANEVLAYLPSSTYEPEDLVDITPASAHPQP